MAVKKPLSNLVHHTETELHVSELLISTLNKVCDLEHSLCVC